MEPLLRVRESIGVERKKIDRVLAASVRKIDATRRLMTIPGVGPVTALAYVAAIDDPARFDTSRALGAHLGMTPRLYQSGEINRSGQISKCGDRMVRHLLYEAASALMTRTRKWSRLRAWSMALAKRRGLKRATVAVARKLAVVMHRIWVTGEEFDYGSSADAAKARRSRRSAGRSIAWRATAARTTGAVKSVTIPVNRTPLGSVHHAPRAWTTEPSDPIMGRLVKSRPRTEAGSGQSHVRTSAHISHRKCAGAPAGWVNGIQAALRAARTLP